MSKSGMTMAEAMDLLLNKPHPVAPFELIRVAGPLSREDFQRLRGLTQRRDDLEELLQDEKSWAAYQIRNGGDAFLDHRGNLRGQVDELNRQIYLLQNPGAPSVAEQGKAHAAAYRAEQKKASEPTAAGLLDALLAFLASYGLLLAGLAGGLGLLMHIAENNPFSSVQYELHQQELRER